MLVLQKKDNFVAKIELMKHMYFPKKILIILSIYCLFTNCSNNIQHKLNIVDTLLEQDSLDKATAIFNTIQREDICTAKDSAYYFLLSNKIDWQKYTPIQSDSTINYAISYYEKIKDMPNLARSYHYKSGIMYCLGKKKEAIILEKKTELLSKKINNDALKYIIYNNLTNYNDNSGNCIEAMIYCKKRLHLANKTNNKEWKAYTLCDIAAFKVARKEYDSAMHYIGQILPIIKYVSNEDQYYIWTNMGKCLADIHPNKAILLYEKALKASNDPIIYGFLGNLYYKEKHGEKAMKLWDKSLSTPDISFQIDILQRQHQYLSEQDREHEAHEVAKRIIALKDSLTTTVQQDSIREIQEMLDREYEEQEAREEKHMLLAICCVLALLIIIVTTVYFIRRRHFKQQIKRHEDEVLDHKKEIEMLQNTSEQSANDLRQMQKTVEMLRNEQTQLLAKGRQRYDEIMQGGNTQLWHKPDFAAFVEYYRMTDGAFVEQLEHDYKNLSPRLMMFETLCHMGYANKEIAQILCVSEDSLRSYKARIKRMVR